MSHLTHLSTTALTLVLMLGASSVSAQNIEQTTFANSLSGDVNLVGYAGSEDACGCDLCDDTCCGSSGSWFIDAEATFFRYHRADGVRVGDTNAPPIGPPGREDVEFDYEASPRITLGYTSCEGRGIRARWWEYDQSAVSFDGDPTHVLSVDTYTFDVEFFQSTELTCDWSIEVSGGIRYNEFDEILRDNAEFRYNSFSGLGGILGFESRHYLRRGQLVFRGRGSILMDDKFVFNRLSPDATILRDSVQGMMEIAIAYEIGGCIGRGMNWYAGTGVEWQNWYNYSSGFDSIGAGVTSNSQEDRFDGQSDVGFGGFFVSAGLVY